MPVRIVALSGSLRAGSLNTALLRTLRDVAGDDVDVVVAPPLQLPLFNEELEASTPRAVVDLVELVASADAVAIATPEYNHGMTGVLKNALDWLSRGDRPLRGMPVAIMGVSPGMIGTARAQEHLRGVLSALGATTLPAPGMVVGRARDKFDDDLQLDDGRTRKYLARLVQRLVDSVGQGVQVD